MTPIRAKRRAVFALICAAALALPPAHAAGAAKAPKRPPPSTAAATASALSQSVDDRTQALARAHSGVVGVFADALEDARSIESLGRHREGSGVVIGEDGLVLTIGYLLLEADHIDVVAADGVRVPARVVAYDVASGFGLLQALVPLRVAPVPLGDAGALPDGEPLLVVSGADGNGSGGTLSLAHMVSRRAFSGTWEYHLDAALFTAPPHRAHSGAALFTADGALVGIGSLLVGDALGRGQPPMPGNMFVPVDLLKPILGELRERGASSLSRRAWLGLNCVEIDDEVRVLRVMADGPAEEAGLRPGDHILAIDDAPVSRLEALYKTLWSGAGAERDVMLQVRRGGAVQAITVHSRDRSTSLRKAAGV